MKSLARCSQVFRWVPVVLLIPISAHAQEPDTTLLKRWVGNYLERPLTLEFYGDTMLVVGDRHALNYRMTYDSLVATGDTTVIARYRLARNRLLLEVPDGNVITMASQRTLGRPLIGRWTGEVDSSGTYLPVELILLASRVACWRRSPDGQWTLGEWDRQTRKVSLTWEDSEWTGLYDPPGNSLMLDKLSDSTNVSTSPTGILRRVFRGAASSENCPSR